MPKSTLTYEEAVGEIEVLKKQIQQYQVACGNESPLLGSEYPKALKRLMYLKNRLARLRKKG